MIATVWIANCLYERECRLVTIMIMMVRAHKLRGTFYRVVVIKSNPLRLCSPCLNYKESLSLCLADYLPGHIKGYDLSKEEFSTEDNSNPVLVLSSASFKIKKKIQDDIKQDFVYIILCARDILFEMTPSVAKSMLGMEIAPWCVR